MQEISVNDLPKYSPWIARLLGLEPFSKRVRNPYQVNAEYDQDKYLELLAHFYEHPDVDHELLRLYETGANADGDTYISKEGKLSPRPFQMPGIWIDRLWLSALKMLWNTLE